MFTRFNLRKKFVAFFQKTPLKNNDLQTLGRASAAQASPPVTLFEPLEPRVLLSAAPVVINTGESYTFTQNDGDVITIAYAGRSGAELAIVLSDDASCAENIVVLNSLEDRKDSVTISVNQAPGGDGRFPVEQINIVGSLKSLTARTTDLTGSLTARGVIDTLILGDLGDFVGDEGMNIIYNMALADPTALAPKGVKMTFDEVEDTGLALNGVGVSSLQASRWDVDNGVQDQLIAGWFGTVKITGRAAQGDRAALNGLLFATLNPTGADTKGVAIKSASAEFFYGDILANAGAVKAVRAGTWNANINALSLGKFETYIDPTKNIRGTVRGNLILSGANNKGVAVDRVTIPGDAARLSIFAEDAVVNQITVGQWTNGGIYAAGLNKLTTKAIRGSETILGNCAAELMLDPSGYAGRPLKYTLGKVNVAGSFIEPEGAGTPAEWNIVGDVGSIIAKNQLTDQDWEFLGTLKSLKITNAAEDVKLYVQDAVQSISVGAAYNCDFACGVEIAGMDHGERPVYVDFANAGTIKSLKITGLKADRDADVVQSCFVYAGEVTKAALLNTDPDVPSYFYVPDSIDSVRSYGYRNTRTNYRLQWRAGQALPDPWVNPIHCPIQAIV